MESPTSPYVGPPASSANALPLTPAQQELIKFLATAPRLWTSPADPPVRKFKMANGEEISCVFWKGRFFITGTDIVKILIFHFQQMGRGILNPKKFEEGVFSDLRNLKPGVDAVLEEPRSEFLEFLHKHGCIRTQKKQKVFFWNQVPHEDLLREALERQMKRVTSAFHMTHMMNSPDLLKHYMMMPGMPVMAPGPQGPAMLPMMAGPVGAHHHPYMYPPPSMAANGLAGIHLVGGNAALIGGGGSNLASPTQATATMATTAAAGAAPSSPIAPTGGADVRTHPRRTISLSAVDFTSRPMMAMDPTSMGGGAMPEMSSVLSSPMFSSELDLSGDGYFDLGPATPLAPPSAQPVPASDEALPPISAAPPRASPGQPADPMPSVTLSREEDTSAPGGAALLEGAAAASRLEGDLSREFDALTAPPSDMLFDSNDLLGGVWPYDKNSSLDSPLWDDLSMMIPNAAPNLRDSQ